MHLHIDSDEYWQQVPERLKGVREIGENIGMPPTYFVMGDKADDDVPVAVAINFEPGCYIIRHAHPCHRFEVVVRGTLTTAEGEVLLPGDIMMAAPGEAYGPATAGPQGCVTIEIFTELAATHNLLFPTESGELVAQDILQLDPEQKAALADANHPLLDLAQ